MATWTSIPDSLLEPGKPIRSVDALALRDNPIAIAEGAAGAPKIAGQQGPAVHTGGIANSAVTNAKIANGAVNNVKIANMDAGKLNSGTVPGARMPTGAGGVGTYALVKRNSNGTTSWNQTIAGSSISVGGSNLSGTWRIMSPEIHRGTSSNPPYPLIESEGLAVRIS